MSRDRGRRLFRLDLGAKRVTRDVDDEIEFHLAMRARALEAEGLSPDEARARAAARFGDSTAVRSECVTIDTQGARARRASERLDHLRVDAAYAVRALRQHPGFAIVVATILALGIGANTATFRVIDALMLRVLPVPHPERLIAIGDPRRTGSMSNGTPRGDLASYPVYVDLRDQNHVLSGVYASGRTPHLDIFVDRSAPAASHTGAGAAPAAAPPPTPITPPPEREHIRTRFVSGNFFSVLGVGAAAGRTFGPDQDRVAGGDPVVVISYDYWQRRFAGDRATVGRPISINDAPFVIMGVAARGFTGDIVGQPTDLWLPITMQPIVETQEPLLADRSTSWLLLMGRLAPGVSVAQARAAIAPIIARSIREHATAQDHGNVERSLRERPTQIESGARGFSYYRVAFASALFTLTAAVGLVLLVVCANVANLMLARAASRGREISVRIALGASRGRLVQQLLTESVLLAAAGGAAGLLVAWWGSVALLQLAADGPQPLPLDLHFDARVLGYTAVLALATAVLFGLAPALRSTRRDIAAALRSQGRGASMSAERPGKIPLGKGLVVAQMALSMLLLVGTGMLVRSTQRLQSADVGVDRDHLVIAEVDAERTGYTGDPLRNFMRDLLVRARAVPGVQAASLSENGIFSGTESGTTLQVEGYTARADSDTVVAYDDVGSGYFHAVGARLLRGRDFEDRDNETAPKVAVVNQTMARFFFPRRDALGRHITADSATWEIVGIVGDVQDDDVRGAPVRRVYFPTVQILAPPRGFKLELRTTGDPALYLVPIRQALSRADPRLTVLAVDPLTGLIQESISQDRLVARTVSFFGALALVLSALGLYGVMAYATVRRTSEFGLRMALGAASAAVTRMVVVEAMTLAGLGIAIGLPVALAASQLIRGQLFHIGVFDPPSIGLAVVVLSVCAGVAAYLPALRASRVAPLMAMRSD